VVGRLPARNACPCANALSGAIITAPERIGDHQRRDLAPIIGRYLPFETPTV
jgi:hypothetical protein